MDIKLWLFHKKQPMSKLASIIDMHPSYIRKLCSGFYPMRKGTAMLISAYTGGEVTVKELMELHEKYEEEKLCKKN